MVDDNYTKYLEVFPIKKIDAKFAIHHLRTCLANFGLPEVLISDNYDPAFASKEFKKFVV